MFNTSWDSSEFKGDPKIYGSKYDGTSGPSGIAIIRETKFYFSAPTYRC
jgi:hypothetical protein